MLAEYEFRDIPIHVFKTENSIDDFPLKFHKQLELCYVLNGVLNVEIEGKNRTLKAGDVYLAFPNIPHAVFNSSASIMIAIFDCEIVQSYHEILSHQKPKDAVIPAEKLPKSIESLFHQIFDFSGITFCKFILQTILCCIIKKSMNAVFIPGIL